MKHLFRTSCKIVLAFFVAALPAFAINVTLEPGIYVSNSTDYNATIHTTPGSFVNNTDYNMTLEFGPSSMANNSEALGTILLLSLDMYSMVQQNSNQTLSVIVTSDVGGPASGVAVNGTVTAPNGTQVQINFTEMSSGNYTHNFTFGAVGNWTIGVTAAKGGFANTTSAKTIYIGLVEFVGFSGSSVFQGATAYFDISIINNGVINSTVTPYVFVFDGSWNVVFNKSGTPTNISSGGNSTQFQRSLLSWSVGSTPAGTYNATGYIIFTDTLNATVQTPNRTFLFQVNSVPTGGGGGGGSGGGVPGNKTNTTKPTNTTPQGQPGVNVTPSQNFVRFDRIPILIEAYPGFRHDERIHIRNPTGTGMQNLQFSIKDLPYEWFLMDKYEINLEPYGTDYALIKFTMPSTAQPGTYHGKFSVSGGNITRDLGFIIRINPVLEGQSILVSEMAFVMETEVKTEFVLSVRNRNRPVNSVKIIENIDKSIAATTDDIEFTDRPDIIQDDPVLRWVFTGLAAGEERNATYRIGKTFSSADPFYQTSIQEIQTSEDVNAATAELPSVYLIMLIIPIGIVFAAVVFHRIRDAKKRYNMIEAELLAERLKKMREKMKEGKKQ